MDRSNPTANSVFAHAVGDPGFVDSGFADPDLPQGRLADTGLFPFLLRMLGWGCSHDDYTVPMRLPGGTELTVSCLECGARLRYDWQRMALADRRSQPGLRTGLRETSQATRGRHTVTNDRGTFSPASQSSGVREAA